MSLPTCRFCGHQFTVGETAWVQDWWVVDGEGTKHERRYACDKCNERLPQ